MITPLGQRMFPAVDRPRRTPPAVRWSRCVMAGSARACRWHDVRVVAKDIGGVVAVLESSEPSQPRAVGRSDVGVALVVEEGGADPVGCRSERSMVAHESRWSTRPPRRGSSASSSCRPSTHRRDRRCDLRVARADRGSSAGCAAGGAGSCEPVTRSNRAKARTPAVGVAGVPHGAAAGRPAATRPGPSPAQPAARRRSAARPGRTAESAGWSTVAPDRPLVGQPTGCLTASMRSIRAMTESSSLSAKIFFQSSWMTVSRP